MRLPATVVVWSARERNLVASHWSVLTGADLALTFGQRRSALAATISLESNP